MSGGVSCENLLVSQSFMYTKCHSVIGFHEPQGSSLTTSKTVYHQNTLSNFREHTCRWMNKYSPLSTHLHFLFMHYRHRMIIVEIKSQ